MVYSNMTMSADTARYMMARMPVEDVALHLLDDAKDGDTRMTDIYALRAKVHQEALDAPNKDAWATDPCDHCCPDSYVGDGLVMESCRKCGRGRLMP